MVDEIHHHTCLLVADGDNDIALEHHTERDGGVRSAGTDAFQMRDAEDDHEPSLVHVVTSTLVSIGNVGNKVIGHVEFVNQKTHVVLHGTSDLHPASWLPLVDRCNTFLSIPKRTHIFTLSVRF